MIGNPYKSPETIDGEDQLANAVRRFIGQVLVLMNIANGFFMLYMGTQDLLRGDLWWLLFFWCYGLFLLFFSGICIVLEPFVNHTDEMWRARLAACGLLRLPHPELTRLEECQHDLVPCDN